MSHYQIDPVPEGTGIPPILPVAEQAYYPLTASQKGIFIQHVDGSIGYNSPCILLIEGTLDILRFENVLKKMVNRHDAFKTSFEWLEEEPAQKICKNIDFKLTIFETDEQNEKNVIRSFIKPFVLNKAPLARACLIKTNEQRFIFVFDMHHIISDGASFRIFIDEMIRMYKGLELAKLEIQYKDYAVWYNNALNTSYMMKQMNYWKDRLSGKLPVLNLPTDSSDWMKHPPVGDGIKFIISQDLSQLARKYARKCYATLNTVIFSVFALLLHKYSGQEDIVIGSISEGRKYRGLQNIISPMINVMPIRINAHSEMLFVEFLSHVTERILEAYENQDCPFDLVVEGLSVTRSNSFSPLFNTMIVFHGIFADNLLILEDEGLKISEYDFEIYHESFGIKVDIYARPTGKIFVTLDYNANMFSKERIERMAQHFTNIAAEVIKNPEVKLAEINMLSPDEEKRILYETNATEKAYPKYSAINELFEKQAEKTPENYALLSAKGDMTYKELNEKANMVAWLLKQRGIKENNIIGVMVERSPEMIIGILGILKAGAAYLPIDPDYPPERIKYLLLNSNVEIVVSSNDLEQDLNAWQGEAIAIDNILQKESLPTENLNINYNPDRLMYVLYTSGSTGKPKGVMVKSHAFVNLINWYTEEFKIDHNDRNLLIAPVSFDLAQKNLYATLIKGGELYLYPPGLYDYNVMLDLIDREGITLINCAPGAFYPLLEFDKDMDYKKLSTLRHVFLGGEPIDMLKLLPWLESANFNGEAVNTYGPTECTDIATFYRIKNDKKDLISAVPIGKPIDNVQVYVLDKNLKPVPVGVDGELCIGGVGLGAGYYNEPELTKERFVECLHLPSKRIYRTGDIARWLPDGNLEFRGRIDQQVKIRGYRIELDEIKNILLKHETVRDAVVVDKTDSGMSQYLCAYIIPEGEYEEETLCKYLSTQLPDYMIPAYFILVDEIPLSPNGKVDRNALPDPTVNTSTEKAYISPANEMEKTLTEIWEQVLKIEKLGVTDNLFNLGANSLKIIIGMSKIHKEIGIQIPLAEIFQNPTVRTMSDYILNEQGMQMENYDNIIADIENIEFNF